MQGKRLAKMQRGINIVKIGGKSVKVVKTPSYPPVRGRLVSNSSLIFFSMNISLGKNSSAQSLYSLPLTGG